MKDLVLDHIKRIKNQEGLPNNVIIYRDGVGEG